MTGRRSQRFWTVALAAATVAAGGAGRVEAADAKGAAALREKVRAYRVAHEKEIVGELSGLLALPNEATNLADVQKNAEHLVGMLGKRGFATKILSAGEGTPPAVFGELKVPGAKRTVVFYAHFDGQPAGQQGWLSDPWKPVIRTGPLTQEGVKEVDLASVSGPLGPEWRIYARSASDDKSPIVALLAGFDALKAAGVKPAVNLKIFLEGEEEQGSPHLTRILEQNVDLLAADAWILCDGPVHQTRKMQVYFGARGVSGLDLTVYGPLRPLHSGHYGNWAPNPAVLLVHLVADMRDTEGRILIPGFYDDVRPLNEAEKKALAVLPDVETALKQELALGRTEGSARLLDSVQAPSLNVRGLRSAEVGGAAANAIPTEAQVSIDFRLVPDQRPEKVRDRVNAWLKEQGWHLVPEEPDRETRMAHPKVARVRWSLDYPAARTALDLPASKAIVSTVEKTVGEPVIQVPMLGGSVPMYLFTDTLKVPVIGVPIVNHDNNQHGINENLRLQNLWDGIEVYAGLIAGLDW